MYAHIIFIHETTGRYQIYWFKLKLNIIINIYNIELLSYMVSIEEFVIFLIVERRLAFLGFGSTLFM